MNLQLKTDSAIGSSLAIISMWLALISWLFGIVLAKGFWMTLCSLFPLYAWYLVVEFFSYYFGILHG